MLLLLLLLPQAQAQAPERADATTGEAARAVQEPALEAAAVPRPQPGAAPAGSADLEAFADGLVRGVLARDHIPGMVVAVVDRGGNRLVRGYGLARVDPPVPADGATTLFRIGSVSKTFTYTLAMQLVEQGRIHLDDPLDLHLPPPLRVPDDGFAQPVRVRHLLTHTAGFEDTVLGHLFEREPEAVLPLDEYLQRWRPRRVRAPDSAAVYSNYGVALLGALAAHVAAQPFEALVEQRLTGPLGMAHTSFREPGIGHGRALDPELAAQLATGYRWEDGAFVAGAFEHIAHGAPAGSASASAADMARWMRLHLDGGTLEGVEVLDAATALRMREVLFANAEGVSGLAHGFLTEQVAGNFVYGHGGATLNFHTAMALVPEHGIGVFVSANAAHARQPVREVARQLLLRLLPVPPPPPPAVALSPAELARYAGLYASNRRPYRSAEKLLLGATATAGVRAGGDGALRVDMGPRSVRFLPTGPASFRSAEDDQRLVFLTAPDGDVIGFVADPGIQVMEKLSLPERPDTLALLLTAMALLSALRLLAPLRRRRGPVMHAPERPGLAGVKALAIASALAWLGFAAAAIVAVLSMLGQGDALIYTHPTRPFLVALALASAAAAMTLLEAVALVPVWGGRWRVSAKLRYSGVVVLGVVTVVVMWQWNLVGMKV
jgi:CubicO group peptidase (beta-lactamase class C family)